MYPQSSPISDQVNSCQFDIPLIVPNFPFSIQKLLLFIFFKKKKKIKIKIYFITFITIWFKMRYMSTRKIFDSIFNIFPFFYFMPYLYPSFYCVLNLKCSIYNKWTIIYERLIKILIGSYYSYLSMMRVYCSLCFTRF